MARTDFPDYFAQDAAADLVDRLVEILDVQSRMVAAGAELRVLVQRYRSSPLMARPAIREQFDELTAVILTYAEQSRALVAAHHRGD